MSRAEKEKIVSELSESLKTSAGTLFVDYTGIDVNTTNAVGATALHAVAARGYDSVISYRVAQGARLDLTNQDNQTPLDVARARRAGDSTIALLQRLGANE